MKKKTSITLPKDLLAELDRETGPKQSRSAFIESVLRKCLQDRQRAKIHARDLDIFNQAAERLNLEAEDLLEYQAQDRD